MNKQQFINYIKSPQEMNAKTVAALENLVKEYPYCQTAESLYTLNLYKEDNFKYKSQLRIASVYASDRKRLKDHLFALKPGNDNNSNLLQKKVILEREKSSSGSESNEGIQLIDLLKSLKTEVNSIVNDPKITQKENLHDLIHRLEMIIPDENKKAPEIKPDVKVYNFNLLEQQKSKENKLRQNRDLIDQFITKEPKIKKPLKSDFFDPDGLAQHSIEDKDGPVSETLAKIYVQQGNLSKAIHIYKKLCLVNPEKSSFFAAQIEKIRKDQIS